jgi:hypothetical protein
MGTQSSTHTRRADEAEAHFRTTYAELVAYHAIATAHGWPELARRHYNRLYARMKRYEKIMHTADALARGLTT